MVYIKIRINLLKSHEFQILTSTYFSVFDSITSFLWKILDISGGFFEMMKFQAQILRLLFQSSSRVSGMRSYPYLHYLHADYSPL